MRQWRCRRPGSNAPLNLRTWIIAMGLSRPWRLVSRLAAGKLSQATSHATHPITKFYKNFSTTLRSFIYPTLQMGHSQLGSQRCTIITMKPWDTCMPRMRTSTAFSLTVSGPRCHLILAWRPGATDIRIRETLPSGSAL